MARRQGRRDPNAAQEPNVNNLTERPRPGCVLVASVVPPGRSFSLIFRPLAAGAEHSQPAMPSRRRGGTRLAQSDPREGGLPRNR